MSHRFSNAVQIPLTDRERIQRQLNSSVVRDKAQGLKTVLSQAASGEFSQAQTHFADVVKLVFERDLEVREMAAAYLVLFSHTEPELTLMIVNAVQKMLRDTSAVVRVQALRLVSALRVPTVAPIVMHLIQEASSDPNALVRAACCQTIGSCYSIDPSLGPELLELLEQILRSPKQTGGDFRVAGWGLAVLVQHWPQRIDFLHRFFRVYVPRLPEFEAWCQAMICPMLIRYCRHYLSSPEDPDAKLLVRSAMPLLTSLNTGTVVAAAAVVLYIGTPEYQAIEVPNIVDRLLGLAQHSALVWSSITVFTGKFPHLFTNRRAQMINRIVTYSDPALRKHALQAISLCNEQELTKPELWDLKLCALAWQDDLPSLQAVMAAITGLVGPLLVKTTISWLTKQATDNNQSQNLASESLMALRMLIQQHGSVGELLPVLLSKMIRIMLESPELQPDAKATIVWLVGIHCTQIPDQATEMLRQLLVHKFAEQAEIVRAQIIELAAKLNAAFKNDSSALDPRIPGFFAYALQLGQFDSSIDVRDRTRLFDALNKAPDNNMATFLLQLVQPAPKSYEGALSASNYTVDSLSGYFNQPLDGYVPLEEWLEREDTNSLREVMVSPNLEREASRPNHESRPLKARIDSKIAEQVKSMSLEEFLGDEKPKSGPKTIKQGAGNSFNDLSETQDEVSSQNSSSTESSEESSAEDTNLLN